MKRKKYSWIAISFSIALFMLFVAGLSVSRPYETYASHAPITPELYKDASSGPPFREIRFSGLPGESVCDFGELQEKQFPFVLPSFLSLLGLYVPVRDASVGEDVADIEKDTAAIQEDTSAIRYYLKALCYKEFSLDHTIQQEWMNIVTLFMGRAINWINNAYDGNPIYVLNPHVYYRNVELGVIDTMIREIVVLIGTEQIDFITGNIAIATLKQSKVDRWIGDFTQDWTQFEEGPKDKAIFRDENAFTLRAFIRGTLGPINNPIDFMELVRGELAVRVNAARDVEEQKLAWGRGFFPWELCGQQVFSGDPEDIRTCVTVTPGSVLQDLTSLVLGSALRQMEQADEYEEWISGRALWAMDAAFSPLGLLGEDSKSSQGLRPKKPAINPVDIVKEFFPNMDTAKKIFQDAAKEFGLKPSGVKGEIFFLDVPASGKKDPFKPEELEQAGEVDPPDEEIIPI